MCLNKDPTDSYHKQTQQAIQQCNTVKQKHKQISRKHKTNSTQTQCINKNTQRE